MPRRHRPSEFARRFGRRLLIAREQAELSLRQAAGRLAELPGRASIMHATIGRHEQGYAMPDAEVLAGYAAVYDRPVGWFFGEEDEAEVPLCNPLHLEIISTRRLSIPCQR